MCQSHLPHPRIATAVKDIINNLIGEIIHEPVWWNMHRDIMSLQIVGCNNKMALGMISFLKHQIRASFSTNLPQLDAKMRCTFWDTHSQWACIFFLTSRAELRPDSRSIFVFRHLRSTAEHKLSASCAKSQLHVSTRRQFVSVCKPFLGTCLHNACLTLCM